MVRDKKNILVTGAAGLVGRAVVSELTSRGHRVVAADCSTVASQQQPLDSVVWLQLDVTDRQLPLILDRYPVDGVIHCAAHPGGRSLQEPTLDVEVNAAGSMRIFEYCARKKIPVLYTSSSIIYGEQPPFPTAENAPLTPGTVYGACKVACENYLRILGEGYGLCWTAVRLFATYGAGHKPSSFQGIVNVMLSQLLAGNRVVVRGSLERRRDLVYVKDAARGLVDALFSDKANGRVVNLGTGKPVTIRHMIETLVGVMGKRLEHIELVEDTTTEGDVFYNSADCSLARNLFGYEPRFTLEQGLRELWDIHRSMPYLVD